MITNPNNRPDRLDDDEDLGPAQPVRVHKISAPDFDAVYDQFTGAVSTKVVNVDAKVIEGWRNGEPNVVHYRSLREMMASPVVKARVRNAFNDRQLKDLSERAIEVQGIGAEVKKLTEASSFNLGIYDDEQAQASGGYRTFPITDVVLPGITSPYSKQMLWADYLDMHRKSWEAATRNPIGKRICRIIPQFVLGRGAVGRIPQEEYQEVWDDFWTRNKMRLRMKMVLRELVMFGEVFLRYFQTRQGLVVRSIDPMTIWDIVTNPDDVEDVRYYHQQYVILNTSNIIAQTSAALAPSTMVIRQIPAEEIDHFAINKSSSEKRGRSELFAILGWLQRFKEFANDRVMINKMRSMFALDVAVDGTDSDLSAAEAQFNTPPGPGAVTIHNKSIAIEFKSTNTSASDAQTDAEMILKIIAIGAGISEQFLGVSAQANRASALISTEPDVKNFEEYREIVEEMLLDASQRVWAGKRMAKPKTPLEFTFPSIAQEDRSGKLKDLGFMEAMDWITKQRAATMAARELEITTYNYDDERKNIKTERGEEPVIAQGLQQLPKIQQTPAEQPGMGAGLVPETSPGEEAGGAASNDTKVTQTSAQMGFRADGGGRALSDTKATLNRPGFTRGGEKAAIKNNRTSGTPLLHADRGEAPHRGWNAMAREKSLAVRREKAKARKMQMLEQAAKATE